MRHKYDQKNNMNLKPLATVAVVAVIAAGISLYSRNHISAKPDSTPTPAPVVVTTPTPLPSPNRTLKPNEKFIAAVGLYIPVPTDMTFKQEDASDGRIVSVGFYLDRGKDYELYGLFSTLDNNQTLESAKKDMDQSTVKEITIGGYKGIEGLITGPKTRYMAIIIKDGKKITFSTIPPTEENKVTTDQLLSTFSFQ